MATPRRTPGQLVAPPEGGQQSYDLAGQLPQALLVAHDNAGTFDIIGLTPNDFLAQHGAMVFDLNKFLADFATICPDLTEERAMNVASQSVEFCSLVLFKLGPESRKKREDRRDKTWVLRFKHENPENRNAPTYKTVFVSTFRNTDEINPIVDDNKMTLTVKQASLIALTIMEGVTALFQGLPEPVIVLTPLAGAIFSKEDVPKIIRRLGIEDTPRNRTTVINSINESCQSGGHYLPHGKMHIAAAATIASTKRMRSSTQRESIISKTIKQYLVHKRQPMENDKFQVYCEFATGGVPSELAPTVLIGSYEGAQMRAAQAVRAAEETALARAGRPGNGGNGGNGGGGNEARNDAAADNAAAAPAVPVPNAARRGQGQQHGNGARVD
ncbi:MAG: putative nucleoprotein [Fushun phasmavirus 1]|uniref:Putative nucleoprotein n=1 Tax=Fushun phasmavirus 1 TaxID=2905464 RepID=A0A8K1XFD8_9VIRU|nr:MAG: putative nucleoprotein [Fushun phasmavirus 1]UHM27605.1 MAG: putative nucleoprotein [Fushun phasmavirus 1]